MRRESKTEKGERRGLNPRMVEPQPTALTTWPHPPVLPNYNQKHLILAKNMSSRGKEIRFFIFLFLLSQYLLHLKFLQNDLNSNFFLY